MNSSVIYCWLMCFLPFLQKLNDRTRENREEVFLTLDKSSCLVGDTVYWRGMVTGDILAESPSTVLYVDLYNESGKLIVTQKTPLISNTQLGSGSYSMGQIMIPDTLATQTLFVRGTTRYQYSVDSTSCFYYPIAVYNPEKFSPQPRFSIKLPPADSVYGEARGISIQSTVAGDSLLCTIKGGNLYSGWGRPLTLWIKGKGLPPDSTKVLLTQESPWASIKMHLRNVSGYFIMALLDDGKVLKGERIYLEPHLEDSIQCSFDTISTQPNGKNCWHIKITDGGLLCNVAVSVTDADRVSAPVYSMAKEVRLVGTTGQGNEGNITIDSHYLEFEGTAATKKGKLLSGKELVADLWRDSSRNTLLTLPLDSAGRFHLTNLYFYDTARLDFQRNNNKWNSDDVRLTVRGRQPPAFRLPDWLQRLDSNNRRYFEDTSVLFSELPARFPRSEGFFAPKELKPIVIKVNKNRQWVEWRDALHKRYNPGEAITPWIVDLVEYPDTTAMNVLQALKDSIAGFGFSPLDPIPVPRLNGKRCVVFIDGENVTYPTLLSLSVSSVAVIEVDNDYMGIIDPFVQRIDDYDDTTEKALYGDDKGVPPPHPSLPSPKPSKDNDQGPPKLQLVSSNGPELSNIPAIQIFTRHPEDWKYLPTTLQEVPIPGFTKPILFEPVGDKRWTLFWKPVQFNDQVITFINNGFTKRFRLHVEGVDALGRVKDFDKIIHYCPTKVGG